MHRPRRAIDCDLILVPRKMMNLDHSFFISDNAVDLPKEDESESLRSP